MADIALAGGEVPLSLSDTLAIAGGMRFYPLVQCVPQMVVPKVTSFLGPLQKMQTGDVLQVGVERRGKQTGLGCRHERCARMLCGCADCEGLGGPPHAGFLPLQAQRLRRRFRGTGRR